MDTIAPRTTTAELSEPDAVRDYFAGAYGADVSISSDDKAYRLTYRRTDAGAFSLNTVCHTADLRFRVEAQDNVVVSRSATARLRRTCGDSHGRYERGDIFLSTHPGRPYEGESSPGELDDCVLAPATLARVAGVGTIRFTGLEPISQAAAAHWWSTRSYVADLLTNEEVADSALLLSSAAQLLAAATLAAFPNSALTDPTTADRRDAASGTLRRAIAYIDEHAADDISPADIAAAANVSVRAVQIAFRRHLDTTPTAYLRRARLHHAHRALIEADPATTTVAAVAARWGFLDHSRFTAAYRRTYAVLPRTTLHGN